VDGISANVKSPQESSAEVSPQDEERYSRQLYVLGARAHSLVRKSTLIVDGPLESGLLYEILKNVALSGVGSIILLLDDHQDIKNLHKCYHNEQYDDLGNAYRRAALEEINNSDDRDEVQMIIDFLQRLNPSLSVSFRYRSDLAAECSNRLQEVEEEEEKEEKVLASVYLCIDRPESTQLAANAICRNLHVPFVSADSVGVYGRVFCDFGPDFVVLDADGEAPRQTLVDRVEWIPQNSDDSTLLELMVYCVSDVKHDVSSGDLIQFHWRHGFEQQHGPIVGKVLYVKSPSQFTIKFQLDGHSDESYRNELVETLNKFAHYFSKLKQPRQVPFLSMHDALEAAKMNAATAHNEKQPQLFAQFDLDKSLDITRRNALMACFSALGQSASDRSHARLSSSIKQVSDDEYRKVFRLVRGSEFYTSICNLNGDRSSQKQPFEKIVKKFARCSDGKFVPVQALIGAIAAQEALKAVSNLYCPIQQFLLYDCDELLQEDKEGKQQIDTNAGEKLAPPLDDKFHNIAPGQTLVLGPEISIALARAKIFVVGSGAIGCELLKNLAASGAATDKRKGKIVVTDMDTIEKSNLSRQLLFRDSDVGKFKSIAAKQAVERFNSQVQIEVHTSKVGEDVLNSPFNDEFWSEKVDIVMNALDNVEARLFMDKQCVQNSKGMIDAGTLGAMGNVQVVVPFQSESYGSSMDPPDPSIPVCTLKNFPYEISHTIQWARDLFDGLYNRRPEQVNSNAKTVFSIGLVELSLRLQNKLGEEVAAETTKEIAEDIEMAIQILDEKTDLMESCIQWAVNLFDNLFVEAIKHLQQQHPEGSVDEDGQAFWSGSRRMPKILEYRGDAADDDEVQQTINRYIVDFVKSAARLRFEMYVCSDADGSTPSDAEVKSILAKADSYTGKYNIADAVSKVDEKIKEQDGELDVNLNVTEFEKDDEKNGHVTFISAASNLRALTYGITPVDALETRRISGNIVPAMITTTALVSALSCIELIKLVKGVPLRVHRNAFVNLALPFFAFTSPLPADPIVGMGGKTHTVWDRTIINEGKKSAATGGIKLSELLKKVEKKTGGCVSSLYYGPYMIYADFLHSDDEIIAHKSVLELIKEALTSDDELQNTEENVDDRAEKVRSSINVDEIEAKPYIELSGVVEDESTGEDAEIPIIRINRWKECIKQGDC